MAMFCRALCLYMRQGSDVVFCCCSARLPSKIKLTAALNDVHIALSPLQPWKTL